MKLNIEKELLTLHNKMQEDYTINPLKCLKKTERFLEVFY